MYIYIKKSDLSARETTVIEKALKMLWQVWQKSNKSTVKGQLICNPCVVFGHISVLSPPYPQSCVNSSYKKERICNKHGWTALCIICTRAPPADSERHIF